MGNVIGLKNGLIQLLLLGIALQICVLLAPFYMQWLVDEALLSGDRDLITVLGCGFLLLVILQTAIGAVRSWVATVLSISLNLQWLGNAFTHLMKLPLPYFEKRHTGDIISRFNSIDSIQDQLTTQFVEALIDGVLVVSTLIMMFLYSPMLAFISCFAVLAYFLLRLAVHSALLNATAEQIVHDAKQETHFLESVRCIQSIRLFSRDEERRTEWMNTLTDKFNAALRISKLSVCHSSGSTFIFNAERIVILWLAALAVLEHRFSVGMMFAFLSYKDQFSQRMPGLINKAFELRTLRLHANRVGDILLTEPEKEIDDAETEILAELPTVEIRNLSFRYSDVEENTLKKVYLTISAGQCVAITGASGSGKTTMIKLLLGLLEPTEGEVLIGGISLSRVGKAQYRNMLGTVMQDDQLFAGSVSDNISFFDSSPDISRVHTCAKLAAIDAEILNMPMGYNTLVGDIGTGLSGGQKQRILLARALYKQPKILVLDEATSHLDLWNEKTVNQAIRSLKLTRIIVAHRPETIAMAERVIVMHQGEIIEDFDQEVDNQLDDALVERAMSRSINP